MAAVADHGSGGRTAFGRGPVGLVRARLLAALDGTRSGGLGLVVAPAGSGKTTLLTQYARAFDGPVWWHVVDGGDAAETSFGRSLAATAGLEMAGGIEAMVAALERKSDLGRVLLVIDDLHRIAQTPAEVALGTLLARAPAWLTVIVASRTMPSFNLSQHELADIAVVDAEQLRFRAWEVETLLRDVYREPLPPDDAATLSRRVGGWAAGLHMFHLSTLGRPLSERRHALAALDGRSRRTRDYLAATVLAELPDGTREFLIRTCVFDRVTAERCVALLGDRAASEAQRVLADLERRQAFTTSDDGGVSFRYHEVLRAHLTVLLVEGLGERGARDWYARAGALLEADGYPSEAIRAYGRAEDWQAVRRLVAGVGAELAGEFARWRDVLPAWLVAEDPWLVLAEGRYWLSRGRLTRAVDLFRHAESLAQDDAVRAACRTARGQAAIWLPDAAAVLPADHPLARLRAATRRHVPVPSAAAPQDGECVEALAIAAAHLLAGDVRAARRTLAGAVGLADADDGVAAIALRLAHAATDLAAGVEGATERLARAGTEAEHAQSPWLVRMARAATALGGDPAGTAEATAVREECLRDGDIWGAALASGAMLIAGVLAGRPDPDALRRLAAQCVDLGAPALAAWADGYAGCADPATPPVGPGGVTPGTAALEAVADALRRPAAGTRAKARAAALAAGLPANHVARLLGADGDEDEEQPRVRCFGGFTMTMPGRELDWTAIKPRTRAALRLLAMHGGRPVHREVLTAALWPEMDQATATRNLHVALSSLRTFLEPGAPRGQSALIVRTGDAYALALPDGGGLDVVAFTEALAAARKAQLAGDVDAVRAALRAALAHYGGELLPEDGPAEWVTAARETFHGQAATAAEQLAAAELEADDAAMALAAAEQCLAMDVYRDRAWRLLADAHRRLGNHAAADRAARDYAAMLASLGLDPAGRPLPAPSPPGREAPGGRAAEGAAPAGRAADSSAAARRAADAGRAVTGAAPAAAGATRTEPYRSATEARIGPSATVARPPTADRRTRMPAARLAPLTAR